MAEVLFHTAMLAKRRLSETVNAPPATFRGAATLAFPALPRLLVIQNFGNPFVAMELQPFFKVIALGLGCLLDNSRHSRTC